MDKLLLAVLSVFVFGLNFVDASSGPEKKAVCKFTTGEVAGELTLTEKEGSSLTIMGKVSNISKDGAHGFHIHQFGNLSEHCMAAGKHFNPHNKTHGAQNMTERHLGDLGNIVVTNGASVINISDSMASLFGPQNTSIFHRAIVIHLNPDDLTTSGDGLGNAGQRIGCCLITSGSNNLRVNFAFTFMSLLIPALKYFY